MSDLTKITELTAWANVKLVAQDGCCDNILTDIVEGERLKILLESMYINNNYYYFVHEIVLRRANWLLSQEIRITGGVSEPC